MTSLAGLSLVVRLAWRQLWGHRRKNVITLLPLALNAALIIVGLAVVGTAQRRVFVMTSSVNSGHWQIQNANGPKEVWLGRASMGSGAPDVGTMDFPKVKEVLKKIPNIAHIVPMATTPSLVIRANPVESKVEEMRRALEADDKATVRRLMPELRRRIKELSDEANRVNSSAGVEPFAPEQMERLKKAVADEMWTKEFARDPAEVVHFLENYIVPMAGDSNEDVLPVLGADLDAYREAFPEAKLYAGTWVPSGKRGILINNFWWEMDFKRTVPRELDRLYQDLIVDKKPVSDEVISNRVGQIVKSFDDIVQQLSGKDAEEVTAALKKLLGTEEGTLTDLVKKFLNVDRTTIEARREFFQKVIAPRITLHIINPGDELLIRAYGKFPTAVSVKVYGIVGVPAFNDIAVANPYHLMDMVSFRVLDGEITDEMQAEFDKLQQEVKVKDVTFADAEGMFSGGSSFVGGDELLSPVRGDDKQDNRRSVLADTFDASRVGEGRVEHAAVILEDTDKVAETGRDIERVSREAGIPLKIVSPYRSMPLLATNLTFLRGIMFVSMVIIGLIVAIASLLAISIVVLGRVKETGILRAVGAGPGLATQALITEMLFVAVVASGVGMAAGVGLVHWLGTHGIQAPNPAMAMVFGGPRLFPTMTGMDLVFAFALTIGMTLVATAYPAYIASRVPPALALR